MSGSVETGRQTSSIEAFCQWVGRGIDAVVESLSSLAGRVSQAVKNSCLFGSGSESDESVSPINPERVQDLKPSAEAENQEGDQEYSPEKIEQLKIARAYSNILIEISRGVYLEHYSHDLVGINKMLNELKNLKSKARDNNEREKISELEKEIDVYGDRMCGKQRTVLTREIILDPNTGETRVGSTRIVKAYDPTKEKNKKAFNTLRNKFMELKYALKLPQNTNRSTRSNTSSLSNGRGGYPNELGEGGQSTAGGGAASGSSVSVSVQNDPVIARAIGSGLSNSNSSGEGEERTSSFLEKDTGAGAGNSLLAIEHRRRKMIQRFLKRKTSPQAQKDLLARKIREELNGLESIRVLHEELRNGISSVHAKVD